MLSAWAFALPRNWLARRRAVLPESARSQMSKPQNTENKNKIEAVRHWTTFTLSNTASKIWIPLTCIVSLNSHNDLSWQVFIFPSDKWEIQGLQSFFQVQTVKIVNKVLYFKYKDHFVFHLTLLWSLGLLTVLRGFSYQICVKTCVTKSWEVWLGQPLMATLRSLCY